MRNIFLALLFCVLCPVKAANLVINEVMAANLGEVIDPSWNFGGWVEIYNPSSASVSLNGMTLSDHKGHSVTLGKQHGSVPAHGYRNLWFDHYEAKEFPAQIDFKLDTDGGTLTLSKGETVLDAVTYPAAISHTSWARVSDGEEGWEFCPWPTPEASNDGVTKASVRLAAPLPSHPGGWIDGTTDFTVAVPDGATLCYTTDGRMPGRDSQQADVDADGLAHFRVSGSKVYRFRCLAEGYLPSAVVTRSFLSRDYTKYVGGGWDVDEWGEWIWVDGYEQKGTLGGFSLLSVVTDPDYLYSDQIGIYVDGNNGGWSYWCYANYYRDWDRPVNVEIYDAEGVPLVNQEADMSMSGGFSRMNLTKSFKLKSNKKFEGANYYPQTGIFPEKPYVRYKDLLVRSGGDDLQDRHQDNALQALVRRSGYYVDSQAYRPVFVFFNGIYKDVLFLREPSNKQYGYSNYGMDTDEMDTLEESDITGVNVVCGTSEAFDELYAAAAKASSSDSQWQRVRELLDVDEYANYFALETYLANQDWPQNNIKMFRDKKDGRFHVVLQDLDACFHEQGNTFDRMENGLNYYYAMAGYQENSLLALFFNLMKRKEFRQRFVDAYCLAAGSVFEPTVASRELDRLYDELAVGYDAEAPKLASVFATLKQSLDATWRERRLDYLHRWSRAKLATADCVTASISASIPDAAILFNGQPVPYAAFNGQIFLPVTLEAAAPAGYEFVAWQRNGSPVSEDSVFDVTRGGNYTAVFRPVEHSEPPLPIIVVNEVSAANSIFQSDRIKRSDWIELYNTTSSPFDLAGCYISDAYDEPHKYRIPDNLGNATVLAPYGHLVLWADDTETRADGTGICRMLHVPFKLANRDNSVVVLTAADDAWQDVFGYHAHGDRESVGRWPDGSASVYRLDHPTIEETNLLTSYASPLVFDYEILSLPSVTKKYSDTETYYDLFGRRVDERAAARGAIVITSNQRKTLK